MNPQPARRRSWRIFLPLAFVLVLAAGWSVFWFYAAARAEAVLAAWRQREASAGRHYQCLDQSIGGYPFRIEVQCRDPAADFSGNDPPLAFKARHVIVASQLSQPDLLIAELEGPLTLSLPDASDALVAQWKLAQASLRGRPSAPQRLSIVLSEPIFDGRSAAGTQRLAAANRLDFHVRLVGGSADDNPVVEVAASAANLSTALHPAGAQPVDVQAVGTLRGLRDLAPKPLPVRLKELQAAGGRFDVTRARLRQGDVIAVASGTLGLNAGGHLDGQLEVTIAGLDRILPALGIDPQAPNNPQSARVGAALGALDRLVPGLAQFARENAGPGLAAGLRLLGTPNTLEGRQAVSLPLRFTDGAVFLGPVPLGRVAPLY
jgi:hypothetical protein